MTMTYEVIVFNEANNKSEIVSTFTEDTTPGARVRKLRENKAWSQTNLAEKTNIPKGRINNWERRSSLPNEEDAEKLAEFFGVDKEDIIPERFRKKYKSE